MPTMNNTLSRSGDRESRRILVVEQASLFLTTNARYAYQHVTPSMLRAAAAFGRP